MNFFYLFILYMKHLDLQDLHFSQSAGTGISYAKQHIKTEGAT